MRICARHRCSRPIPPPNRRFCSERCRSLSFANIPAPPICERPECGAPILNRQAHAKFCSTRCANKSAMERLSEPAATELPPWVRFEDDPAACAEVSYGRLVRPATILVRSSAVADA